jgi:hypothetical protein
MISRLDPDGFPRDFLGRQPLWEPESFALRSTEADLLALKGAALAAGGQRGAAECLRQAVEITEELALGGDGLPGPLGPLQAVWPALAMHAARREPGYLYDLARHLALASTLPTGAGGADPAGRAVAALRALVATGFDSPATFATDPRLTPLRTRPDFQSLLRGAAGTKKPVPASGSGGP